MIETLTARVSAGHALSAEEVGAAVACLIDPALAPAAKADFLAALAGKGETPEEIALFARHLRDLAVFPPLSPEVRRETILDVVGTGGDRLGTFNISTTTAILVSAAGVRVAKHGNRAVTSPTGSADVLEALGIPIDLSPEGAVAMLRDHGFAFFFAPLYHPTFKHIGPARRICAERGQRTLFNFLGPLLNPVRPTAQLMGVPRPELCEALARVLQSLGVHRAMVVCGRAGQGSDAPCFDELSILGDTTIAEFYHERALSVSVLPPPEWVDAAARLESLQGGDRQLNATIIRNILRGEDRGPRRDAVLWNAAAALLVADRVRSLEEGRELAAEVIDCGQAVRKLDALAGVSRG